MFGGGWCWGDTDFRKAPAGHVDVSPRPLMRHLIFYAVFYFEIKGGLPLLMCSAFPLAAGPRRTSAPNLQLPHFNSQLALNTLIVASRGCSGVGMANYALA